MRKWNVFLIFAVILFQMVLPVHGASNTYTLEDPGMTITFPEEYIVMTPDMPDDDPVFDQLGLNGAQTKATFQTSGICLNAIKENDFTEEVTVSLAEAPFDDFTDINDTILLSIGSVVEEAFAEMGVTMQEYDIYHHDQLPFLRFQYYNHSYSGYGIQYTTCLNGTMVNITFYNYSGQITAIQEKTMLSIIDSIRLTNYVPAPTENTPSFKYTDEEMGVSFTVPENWQEEDFSEETEFLDVKFVSNQDTSQMIMYGSYDLWENMTEEERLGYTREDLKNDNFTEEDIKEILGETYNFSTDLAGGEIEVGEAEKVYFNGVEYFKIILDIDMSVYGLDLKLSMVNLVRMENGWAYTFQFGNGEDSAFYKDFEKLMNSVEYPAADGEGKDMYRKGRLLGYGIVSVIGVVILAVCIVKTLRARRAKKAVQSQINSSAAYDLPAADVSFCYRCGTKIPSDSAFCHKCGTAVKSRE